MRALKRTATEGLGYLVSIVVIYNVPVILVATRSSVTDEQMLQLLQVSLLAINPLTNLALAATFAFRKGWGWWLPVLMGLLFIPTVFNIYNASALPYTLVYIAFGMLGIMPGRWLKEKRYQLRHTQPVRVPPEQDKWPDLREK